jgi:FAD/FMN-containing dehydrogenase
VVIDLADEAVTVDPQRRRAVAQGGATWADFDHETQAFGLAVTAAWSPAGLGGSRRKGIGWLLRKHGLTCDNLALPIWSLRTAGSSMRTPSRTATCSGRCAVAAATGVVTLMEFAPYPVYRPSSVDCCSSGRRRP